MIHIYKFNPIITKQTTNEMCANSLICVSGSVTFIYTKNIGLSLKSEN